MHYSKLIHFDLSGCGLSIDGIRYISGYGIRKSRTLRSVHMSSLNLNSLKRRFIRETLRTVTSQTKHKINDKRIDNRVHIATVNPEIMNLVFKSEET